MTRSALLLALLASGCATGSAGFRIGREPHDAAQIAYVQSLLRYCHGSEECAVARLVGAGMAPKEAQKAVLDALIASAGGSK